MATNAQPTSMSLQLGLHRTSASYAIMWSEVDAEILPKAMYGNSNFLQTCKMCQFAPGQDWVGKVYNSSQGQPTVLWDCLVVDPRSFHRKHAAVINGICSIIFLKAHDGSIFEFGYGSCNEAQAALSKLNGWDADTSSAKETKAPSDTDSTSGGSVGGADSYMSRQAWTDDDVHFARSASNVWSDDDLAEIECSFGEDSPGNDISWPSIGSKGHPYECGQVCKFAWRQRGCKDGPSCPRCHICRYTRKLAKTQKHQQEQEQ